MRGPAGAIPGPGPRRVGTLGDEHQGARRSVVGEAAGGGAGRGRAGRGDATPGFAVPGPGVLRDLGRGGAPEAAEEDHPSERGIVGHHRPETRRGRDRRPAQPPAARVPRPGGAEVGVRRADGDATEEDELAGAAVDRGRELLAGRGRRPDPEPRVGAAQRGRRGPRRGRRGDQHDGGGGEEPGPAGGWGRGLASGSTAAPVAAATASAGA